MPIAAIRIVAILRVVASASMLPSPFSCEHTMSDDKAEGDDCTQEKGQQAIKPTVNFGFVLCQHFVEFVAKLLCGEWACVLYVVFFHRLLIKLEL